MGTSCGATENSGKYHLRYVYLILKFLLSILAVITYTKRPNNPSEAIMPKVKID